MDVTRMHSASREVEGSGKLKQTKIRPAARCRRDRDGMVGRAELGLLPLHWDLRFPTSASERQNE